MHIMISTIYSKFLEFPNISTDTRAIQPNSIFFCLKGENYDGNQFVNQALEQGAQYVVTDNSAFTDHPQCFVVKDVLETLQVLATSHRLEMKIPFIGITGTNGKTTTKELINAVLSQKFITKCTKGNLNNHIGVPLTLLSVNKNDQMAIIEMGANHLGEIADLCKMAYPTHGVVTNIGHAHLEGFGSFQNIITTKMGLYDAIIQDGGTLFINAKDTLLTQEADQRYQRTIQKNGNANARFIYYGIDKDTEVNGSIVSMNPYLTISLFGKEVPTHLTGVYNLDNILCAAAIGRFFGVTEMQICEAISAYNPTNSRSQVRLSGSNTIIADYYNANPTSMKAAIDNFALIEHLHKVAILGDMFELGDISKQEHQQIIDLCKSLHIETLFVGTHFMQLMSDNAHFFPSTKELNEYLLKYPIENKMVLIKGSRGVHLENLSFLL